MKEIGHEKAIYRRSNHWLPAGGGNWPADQGDVPATRLLGSELLPVAQQVWRNDCCGSQAIEGIGSRECTLEEAACGIHAGNRSDPRGAPKKVVKVPARRELVRFMVDRGLSERHVLRVVGMSASAYRYQPVPDKNVSLREQIVALAHRHGRYGAGMIYLKLRQAGQQVNHKRVDRLYAEAGLQVKRRRRKKVPVTEQQLLGRPQADNHVWSMGFVFDRTAEGRVIKCLTIVGDATHESVAIVPERAIGGHALTRILDRLGDRAWLTAGDPH